MQRKIKIKGISGMLEFQHGGILNSSDIDSFGSTALPLKLY